MGDAPEEEKAAETETPEPAQAEAEEPAEPAEPENVPLTHDLAIYRAFEALSLLPPTESSQIPDAIEKVKARQQELKRLNDLVMKRREEAKSVKADTQEEPQEQPQEQSAEAEDN